MRAMNIVAIESRTDISFPEIHRIAARVQIIAALKPSRSRELGVDGKIVSENAALIAAGRRRRAVGDLLYDIVLHQVIAADGIFQNITLR